MPSSRLRPHEFAWAGVRSAVADPSDSGSHKWLLGERRRVAHQPHSPARIGRPTSARSSLEIAAVVAAAAVTARSCPRNGVSVSVRLVKRRNVGRWWHVYEV